MGSFVRRAAALGTTTALVVGSSVLATPGTAAASDSLIAGSCDATLSGAPGEPVSIDVSALGIADPLNLLSSLGIERIGTVPSSGSTTINVLGELPVLGKVLNSACEVTVTAVNRTTKAAKDTVREAGEAVDRTHETVRDALGGGDDGGTQKPPEPPQSGGGNDDGGNGGGSGDGTPQAAPQPTDPGDRPSALVPTSNSAPFGNAVPGFSSFGFNTSGSLGSVSSTAPYENLSLDSTPASGLRYGAEFNDYAPDFGMLGADDQERGQQADIANAGRADSLPDGGGSTVGLPVLLAVLALAGASAGLVRTWVLQKAAQI